MLTSQVYTNIRRFKEDLGRYPPHYFVCVPLVLDTLYKRVQVGGQLCSQNLDSVFLKGCVLYLLSMSERHGDASAILSNP